MGLPWQSRVQPLRFHGWGAGSIPGGVTGTPHACAAQSEKHTKSMRNSEVQGEQNSNA